MSCLLQLPQSSQADPGREDRLITLSFLAMTAQLLDSGGGESHAAEIRVRRLSTVSYCDPQLDRNDSSNYVTRWLWYWQGEDEIWRLYDKVQRRTHGVVAISILVILTCIVHSVYTCKAHVTWGLSVNISVS